MSQQLERIKIEHKFDDAYSNLIDLYPEAQDDETLSKMFDDYQEENCTIEQLNSWTNLLNKMFTRIEHKQREPIENLAYDYDYADLPLGYEPQGGFIFNIKDL